MYIRFQLGEEQIVGKLNARALRLFSEQTGRSVVAAIGEIVDWWRADSGSDTPVLGKIPIDISDFAALAYALANSVRPTTEGTNGTPLPPGAVAYPFEDVEERFELAEIESLITGVSNAFRETAELYSGNPILGPILEAFGNLSRELGIGPASAKDGSGSGPSDPSRSASPAASTSARSSGIGDTKSSAH